jgi:hypothetical protein
VKGCLFVVLKKLATWRFVQILGLFVVTVCAANVVNVVSLENGVNLMGDAGQLIVFVGTGLVRGELVGTELVGTELVGTGLVGSGLVESGPVGGGYVGSGSVGSGSVGSGSVGSGSVEDESVESE